MDIARQINECCFYLESTKAAERQKYSSNLINCLESEGTVTQFHKEGLVEWKKVLSSVQECMRKESSGKANDDYTKKAKSKPVLNVADLFQLVIKIALKEDDIEIDIPRLVGYIIGCMKESRMKICYEVVFVKVLHECILCHVKCQGLLTRHHWQDLYYFVKQLCQEKKVDLLNYKCLAAILKWGPSSGLSIALLKNEFAFMTALCQGNHGSLAHFEIILDIATDFCKFTAKDARNACCRFGEDVILHTVHFWNLNSRNARFNEQFVEFCLLQMTFHHPDGIYQDHPCFYAFDLKKWQKCLEAIYSFLTNEIDGYFKFTQQNTSFFLGRGSFTFLSNEFLLLFVEVSRQMFSYQYFSTNLDSDVPDASSKRQKCDYSLKNYISNITRQDKTKQETKNWVWIQIMSKIVELYPEILDEDDYTTLVKVLSVIQVESNEHNVLKNVYDCLIQLFNMKHSSNNTIWNTVSDSTIKALGPNGLKDTIEIFLQKLIEKKIVHLNTVLQTYNSGMLKISLESIKVLRVGIHLTNFSEIDILKKTMIMNFILNPNNVTDCNYLMDDATATLLVDLTLKHLPVYQVPKTELEKMKYHDIKEIYYKCSMQKGILLSMEDHQSDEVYDNNAHKQELQIMETFTNTLKNFVNNIQETIDNLLSITILLMNMLNKLLEYKIISEDEIESNILWQLLMSRLQSHTLVDLGSTKCNNKRDAEKFMSTMNILYDLFSMKVNDALINQLKYNFPRYFLDSLLLFITKMNTGLNLNEKWKFQLKSSVIKVLARFCSTSGSTLNENQNEIMKEMLSLSRYDETSIEDCHAMLTAMSFFKYATPGVLPLSILKSVFENLQYVVGYHYQCNETAIKILNVIHDLLPHFFISMDYSSNSAIVRVLQTFYDLRENYGPDVSLRILDNLVQLCNVDSKFDVAKWDDEEVIQFMPILLKSDYQEIRLYCIRSLAILFKTNEENKTFESFKRQERILSDMFKNNILLLDEMYLDTENDELISKSASVLHSFTTVIINSPDWIQEGLMYLVKLAYKRTLVSVSKALNIINERLSKDCRSVVEMYLEYLIERWLAEGLSFDDFPFYIFLCQTKTEFYQKYLSCCGHFLIVTDKEGVLEAAKRQKLSDTDLQEMLAPKIFSKIVYDNYNSPVTCNIFKENDVLAYFVGLSSLNEFINLLVKHLDQVLLSMLNFLTDETYILDVFQETVMFGTKRLSISDIKKCFDFIQTLLNLQQLEEYLAMNLKVLERVLLKLKRAIYDRFTMKDQLIMFHRYACFVDIVFQTKNNPGNVFVIRDSIYFNINFIEKYKTLKTIPIAVMRYFFSFIEMRVEDSPDIIKQFLSVCINAAKKFMDISNTARDLCVKMMKLLVIENVSKFTDAIQKLDNFSLHPDFDEIRAVHHKVKYGDNDANIKDEIISFLECNNLPTQDSLNYLRNTLAKNKTALKAIYDKLPDIRGFSEDCKKSLLHRLISTLAELSCSANEKVSFEAMKCLGEIGPANLTTLVLRPEKEILNLNYTPVELLCGNVLLLVIDYLIDPDIEVVEVTSDALYVLYCKEAKVIGSHEHFGFDQEKQHFISPFSQNSKFSYTRLQAESNSKSMSDIDSEELWCPNQSTTHELWVTNLTVALLETSNKHVYFEKLANICNLRPKFAEHILPLLINLLMNSSKASKQILIRKIDDFFDSHWNYTVPQQSVTNVISLNKKSVKCMLDVVGFVRMQISFKKAKRKPSNELNINYLKVAKAAEYCDAHFSALLYSELWCQSKIEDIQNENESICQQRSSVIDNIYERESEEVGIVLNNILRSAYKGIGDLDALSGCGISFLMKPEFRVEHYKEHGKWDQVMHFYDMQLSIRPDTNPIDLFDSFTKCGLYQVPFFAAKNSEIKYECSWRLGQWNFQNQGSSTTDDRDNLHSFEKYRFYSLKYVNENNPCLTNESLKWQKLCILEDLRHNNFESSQNLYPILTQLQSIVEMDDFVQSCAENNFQPMLDKWKLQDDLLKGNNFEYIEPVMTQRLVMLTDYLKKHNHDILRKYLIDFALDFACLAKDEDRIRDGLRVLENLKVIQDLNSVDNIKIQLMEAQLSWLADNNLVSKHILNTLCKSDIDLKLKSTALKLLAKYTAESNSGTRLLIIENYLRSTSIIKDVEMSDQDYLAIVDTYDELAQFADKQYQQIMTYMKSSSFQRKVANMEKIKETATNIQKQRKRTVDESKAANVYTRNSNIDQIEINTTREECNTFLQVALKYYLVNISHSDRCNIRIFRVMALFLENRNNPGINETIKKYLPKIPTHKFIPILPQLIPHITEFTYDLFSEQVNEIISKCAKSHPHHTLPLLLSLAHANKDREYDEQKTNTEQNDARMSAATTMINSLKRTSQLEKHITKLEQLSNAFIELAYFSCTESKEEYNIPRSQKISRINNFDEILLPTYSLKVNPSGKYSIVGIYSFAKVYHPVGGINAPKKIYCRGTDGLERTLLVKGNDDLRQDAVMQQVFSIMNDFFRGNKDTKNLLIRTYKIVPLSRRSGVLEWVDGSMPIGNYLVGTSKTEGAHKIYRPGAHEIHRPQDKSPSACRDMFKRCAGSPVEKKLATYKAICKDFKPVMHKFFETYFPQPTVWYERRRAYIHSVATTSMCGYILGIGDRHVSNILIDTCTAEVIHIDFGIAFEQGRVLPTPETVPFRLTRDIVDGMGASGVDGIFRRSCEKTIKVLRQNSQTIITILEVLLYDPLYAWTVSPAEANKRQTDDDIFTRDITSNSEEDVPVNVSAERALLRLKEKLQGTELGQVASIEHQVEALIQQAIDPANLCKLFVGWQPYL